MPKLKADLIVDDKGSIVVKNFTDKTKRYMHSAAGSVKGVTSALTSMQGMLAGAGFALGAKHILDTASSFEQLEKKLNALTNGQGAETLDRINAWALDMPVNTKKAVDTFAMMQAMGLDPTIAKMQTLVDVSSIFGEDTMPRVARALGQMKALGKLSAEELNQMSEAGINARKYLTEAFSMSVPEIQKSGKDIDEVIQVIMNGLDRDFGGAAKANMDSWVGIKATTESYITELERRVMDAGLFTSIKEQLSGVNEELKDWVDNNGELINQKVPEYVENVKTQVTGLFEFFNGLPDGTSKALMVAMLTGKVAGPAAGAIVGLGTFISDTHKQHGFSSKWNTVDAPFNPDDWIDQPESNPLGKVISDERILGLQWQKQQHNDQANATTGNDHTQTTNITPAQLSPSEYNPDANDPLLKEITSYQEDMMDIRQKNLTDMEKAAAGYRDRVLTPFEKMEKDLASLDLVESIMDPEIFERNQEYILANYDHTMDQMESGMEDLADKTDDTTAHLSEFWRTAYGNMQDVGASFFQSLREGSDDWLTNFTDMTLRMVDQWLAAQAMMGLFGDAGSTGQLGGIVGAGAGALAGGGAEFFGNMDASWAQSFGGWLDSLNSYDVGTDYVPHDMIAKIHQGEKITPASKNRSAGSQAAINITNQITVQGSGDKAKDQQSGQNIAMAIKSSLREFLGDELRPGGILNPQGVN